MDINTYNSGTNNKLDRRQRIQENQYSFPYHHFISAIDGNFTQTKAIAKGYEYLSYIHFVMQKVNEHDFGSLLDVGCGDGKFLAELYEACPKCPRFVGLDYSQRAVDLARFMTTDMEIEFVCDSIEGFKGPGGSFDIITLIEVLEHIPLDKLGKCLESLHSNLNSNGYLFITVPSDNTPVQAAQKHYQHFNIESLQLLLDPLFSIEDYYLVNKKSFIVDRIIQRCFYNNYFIINHKKFLTGLYAYYKNHYFHACKANCKRIVAICRKE